MRKLLVLIVVTMLLLVGCENAPTKPSQHTEATLEVHFIDVGQGDSILVKLSSGENILIDGGDRSAGPIVTEYLRSQDVTEIDLMVSSHPHQDHIGGLISVLNEFPVKRVLDPAAPHTTQTFEEYLTLILEKEIPFTVARAGQTFDYSGVTFKVLSPADDNWENLNNASVVLKATIGEISFLFTGDAEREAEDRMLDPAADILKIGHHGSNSSTQHSFLSRVNPKVAIIMCGLNNQYGHPHQEVLDRLDGIEVYRTDLHGTIIVVTDGQTYNVSLKETIREITHAASSRNSEVFHALTCESVSQIAPQNLLEFTSREEAVNSGRRPCQNCNGGL